ncbi:glutamate-gated chloride channel isoform X2 [Folsomia candida]|uniref:glutamate-gated chloride channel isoform X2 n=1 Tax=Folsomia candida TaxID=158441 RepID=UPI0016054051|nr:glutamate-gated chloride channel isoform X2 [Folsomia candida]
MDQGSSSWFLYFFLCTLLTSQLDGIEGTQKAPNNREIEKRILDKVMNTKVYDNKIRPVGAGGEGATVVNVNLFVRSIARIDDVKMEYSVQLTFREQWLDDRLRFDNFKPTPPKDLAYLTLTDSAKVWMPDLFFSNERQGHLHNIITPNVYIRIFPNGEVLYSIRISLTLSCPMILKLFPLDKQVCTLRMASYGWTTEDVIFKWKSNDPVQVTKDLHLPRFALEQFTTDYCDSVTNTGTYSCLRVDLLFKRQFSYYLLQIYIPGCMLVIVSWVSFWLDAGAVPARVSLGVTTLLTMATQTSGINQKLPPVSYTKALDVWTGVCLTFVFGALLEFALVNYASRNDQHRSAVIKQRKQWEAEQAAAMETAKAAANSRTPNSNKPIMALARNSTVGFDSTSGDDPACPLHFGILSTASCTKTWLSRFPSRSKRIDVIARIVFPLLFAFFNVAYWCAYVLRKEDPESLIQ